MKKKNLSKLNGLVLALLILAGIGMTSGSTVQAQGRHYRPRRIILVRRPFYNPFWDPWNRWDRLDRYRYSQYVFSDGERAYNQGYKDGLKVGQGDAKNRRTYKPERSHYYSEAGFGNFGEVYRRGFSEGYARGFQS